MKIFKQAALAVVLASTLVEVDGFNLPKHRLEPAINQQRQLVTSGSVPIFDVKSIKSSGKLFLFCLILCVLCCYSCGCLCMFMCVFFIFF